MSGLITSLDRETVRTHDLRGFSRIRLHGLGLVEVVQGDREGVEVQAPDNLHDQIRVTVDGESLSIGLRDEGVQRVNGRGFRLVFRVWVRSVHELESSGAGRILASHIETQDLRIACSGAGRAQFDAIHATDLSVRLSGAGKIKLGTVRSEEVSIRLDGAGKIWIRALTADRLQGSISGAGEVQASGKVDRQELTISGAGSMLMYAVDSRTSIVTIPGVGKANVSVSDTLEASVLGMGKVEYGGSPQHVRKRTSGIGAVVRRQGDGQEGGDSPRARIQMPV